MPSRLAIFDPEDLTSRTVLVVPGIIESPSFTRDGAALIVNGEGRLWRVALDRPALEPVDTGFAVACNNDHGLSPDGAWLAISDRSRTEGSAIYVLPSGGGTPRLVTPNLPSYWHGWSPDGARLAYVGKREGAFDVYTIPVEGGRELRLTRGFEHTDGPDYAPDGRWIWFNGQRDGVMDLWRVRPDGADLERMTRDDHANWFPHPCPAGGEVLYLAYPPGTEGHPRDLPVSLRLLDPETGAIRVLYEMTGGQGTLNTPPWSPDGRRFAFVETV